ncbi:MAG TPA: hypothetical protein VGD66_02335 [Allosphingosinicella sp.]|jgi:hypothetical protein
MTPRKITALCTAAAFAMIGFASPASAQATRTWVSGVGDDVNPCSRTAPCKTFAGAISKTAAGGEINCLDPGGFGAVTINKTLVIDCHYTEGGDLAGGNGVVVNLPAATDVVVLRGLDIFGVNPPSNGVRFIASGSLHIEDCVIRRFNAASSAGVSFAPSGVGNLYITNTTITQNGNGATGGGIVIAPTAGGSVRATLDHARTQDNANAGIRIDASATTSLNGLLVTIVESQSSGNAVGLQVIAPVTSTGTNVMVSRSTFSTNTTGVSVDGADAVIRMGRSTVAGNNTGLSAVNSGLLRSYITNEVNGNLSDGVFNGPVVNPS